MARTLHVDGNSGKAYIYKGEVAPATYANPSATQLGDLHFHSDLSYLGNTQVLEATITHPERVRSSSSSKWGGTTYRTRQGTQSFVLGTNTLGTISPAVAFFGSAQMPAGTVVHKVGQSVRAVSIMVTASQIRLFENWLTFDDTLPAVSRTYRIFVLQTLFTGSGNTSIAIAPGTFTAGFGKLSTSYRYLRRADTLPDAFVTAGRTADVQSGGVKVVLPDGSVPLQSATYTGSFTGMPGTGVRI
ncbi:MAG: hypothetical protein ABF255_13555 [Planktotalea arctica]|uniref:hypothetical protein n=1 Tax=Planktotalea arctica TaxID=1481893 RepID=UPI00321BCA3C